MIREVTYYYGACDYTRGRYACDGLVPDDQYAHSGSEVMEKALAAGWKWDAEKRRLLCPRHSKPKIGRRKVLTRFSGVILSPP